MPLFDYTKEGKGVSKQESQGSAVVALFKRYGRNFWRMVLLNLLYLFACAPLITIGPATAGLNYVMRNYSQGKPVDMFSDFFDKAREYFGKSVIISLINALLIAVTVFAAYMWSETTFPVPGWLRPLALFFVFFIAYVFICTNLYIFPMMVSFDLSLKKTIKNSIILGMYKIGPNLLMLAFNIIIILACVLLWPASLSVIILLPFSTCCFFNNFMIYPVLVKHVAVPAEPKPEQPDDEPVFKDIT